MLYSQYSAVLVIVFLAFMYGLFIPIMFPLAAIGIFNYIIMENLLLTYLYRKPPNYDDSID